VPATPRTFTPGRPRSDVLQGFCLPPLIRSEVVLSTVVPRSQASLRAWLAIIGFWKPVMMNSSTANAPFPAIPSREQERHDSRFQQPMPSIRDASPTGSDTMHKAHMDAPRVPLPAGVFWMPSYLWGNIFVPSLSFIKAGATSPFGFATTTNISLAHLLLVDLTPSLHVLSQNGRHRDQDLGGFGF
jgi:hypothetical protein